MYYILMKGIMKRTYVLVGLLLLLGCSDLDKNIAGLQNKTLLGGTKGAVLETFYWYHGKMLGLTFNREYINLVIDTTKVTRSEISMFCSELGLNALSVPNKDGIIKASFKHKKIQLADYREEIDMIRNDSRILCVCPYFEQGEGMEPVGTTQVFYVHLKELVPEGLSPEQIPYLEKAFDYEALKEEAERWGVRIVGAVPYMPNWYVVSIENSSFENTIDAANRFYESGGFEETDPAFMLVFNHFSINDPLFSLQWGLKNTINPGYDINVEGAWTITSAGADCIVAVVDDRIDPSHYDLSSNLYSMSYDISTGGPCTHLAGDYHGTHVAGIIGAIGNNNTQIAGVAYNSAIMRVRMMFEAPASTLDQIASGISWAWQNGAEVINCSWGATASNAYSALLENALTNAMTNGRYGKGSVVVFAIGNTGNTGSTYPACFDERIITVGSINSYGLRDSTSTYGSALDVVAPGEEILSLMPMHSSGYLSGTSMAAPHVSGVIAMMLAANSSLKQSEVARIIKQTARKISPGGVYSYLPRDPLFSDETWNQEVGCGLVDAKVAVTVAKMLGTTPSIYYDSGINVILPAGMSGTQHEGSIVSGYFPHTVYASLLPENTNPSYRYFWYVTAPAHPYWHPSISAIDGDGIMVSVPNPGSYSTMYIRCFIFNGDTLVSSPSYTLHVNP